MAGYIMNLDGEEALKSCIESGVYGTRFNKIPLNEVWTIPHEGTFADYIGMQAGDNIYFFIKRKIYGIGTLVNKGLDCKYLNFPGSDRPVPVKREDVKRQLLYDNNDMEVNIRSICLFEPSPYFF